MLPVMTGAGAWFELTATPDMWRRISAALGEAVGPRLPQAPKPDQPAGVGGAEAERLRAAVVRTPIRKPSGQLL